MKKRPLANLQCDDDSEDSGNSSNNNKHPRQKSEQRLESMIERVEINLSFCKVVYKCDIFV